MSGTDSHDIENSCLVDGNEAHNQYGGLVQEYDQFSGYPASSIYVSKSSGTHVVGRDPRAEQQCSYQSCTLISTKSQLPLPTEELSIGNNHNHGLGAVRFMNSGQYDELLEYGIASGANCPVDSHFAEDTTSSYGYASETNYIIPNTNVNSNSFSRPIMYSTMNDADMLIQTDGNDIQSKLSQLSLNPHDGNREMIENHGSDIFPTMRWRDPNLTEVISFLSNPNNSIKANAAAYLQHLCYMDDPNKQRTRQLGGVPPLIRLLSYDIPEIHKNACGALRNLSYGRQNDENKRAIKNAGGIPALVNLLCKTQESEVKELVTGVLWNMSSCEDIKRDIIDESLTAIVLNVIRPHSGWDPICPGETCFSTVFRNASGVLRNVSSAGEHARASLRNCEHLIECLFYVVKTAIEKSNIGNKTVENCVCILRNLSYRCQEVEDPNYDKQPQIQQTRSSSTSNKGENLGCFGTSKKKKDCTNENENSSVANNPKPSSQNSRIHRGYEQLWQPEVIQYYLSLLQSCSNPETLEASAGAIQNLAACYWQPSIDIRATVRKEKGLPILVELLRMEVDRVVCAVATALRNLAIDQRNKELIGKYAMRDLVQKLPSGIVQHDQNTSDDTISAVLATINEVIKKNPEFSRSLLEAGGVDRLMYITKHRQKYTSCVIKFASQVLFTMWQHYDLRDVYKKNGWKEQDFVSKSISASNTSHNSPNNTNNTLNRPMASQSRTRYEDRTIQRAPNIGFRNNVSTIPGYSNDPQLLCQMVDDVHLNGINDSVYQRDGHGHGHDNNLAMYTPLSDRVQSQAD